ncbi:DUF5004 domain-containing protein [Flavobacterium sp. LAR06]|uniref:DUF5004 domain-containing protein n=1 Tax=Flavobacterium sp. LAR06 TaxID=3064897 RepID=UPI0035C245B1
MKKTLQLSILLLFYMLVASCNSDENSASVSKEEEKLVGTWEVTSTGSRNLTTGVETIKLNSNACKNSYTFNDDKTINYKNYFDCSDMDEEDGTWSLVNGLLTRTFPKGVTVVMKDNITFMSGYKIKLFKEGDNSNFTIYEKKSGTTIVNTSYKVEVGGILKTNSCGASTNSYSVKMEYLSDDNIKSSLNFNGSAKETILKNENLSGKIIGVHIKLLNFNSADSASGSSTGIANLSLKIIGNQSNETLFSNSNLGSLFICHDTIYEALFLYNTKDGTFTPTFKSHGF